MIMKIKSPANELNEFLFLMLKKITIYLVHEIDTFKNLSKAFTLVIFYMDTQVSILKIKK